MFTERKRLCLVCCALVTVQLGFGAHGVIVTKFAKNEHADPFVFCAFRNGGAFPVLMLAALVLERRLTIPSLREFPIVMALGFMGMFAGPLLYIMGLYHTSADVASIFQPITPVWATVVAALARVEPLPSIRTWHGRLKILGIIFAVCGAVIMTTYRNSSTAGRVSDKARSEQLQGYGALMLGTIVVSFYMIVQKKLVFNNPSCRLSKAPVSLTAWSYFFGFIFMSLTAVFVVRESEKFTLASQSVLPLVYAVLITSALCYVLLSWCNMQISPTAVTASWSMQVLFCVVLAYFALGETLVAAQVAGAFLIIAGMLAVLCVNYREEIELRRPVDAVKLRSSDMPLSLQADSTV